MAHTRDIRRALKFLAGLLAATASVFGGWLYVDARHHDRGVGRITATTRSGASRPAPGHVQILSVRAADAPSGQRKVWIYRPGVPDSATVPVVYFLHGLPGSYRDIQSVGGMAMLDRLVRSEAVKPFVLAVPDGNSTKASDPEWANSADGSQRIESFVTGPLREAVEGAHRRDRAHRSIVGFSMGGYGAMNIGLRHPDLYGAIASIAGYFHSDDESGIYGGDPAVIASNRPDQHLGAARQVRLLLAQGTGDSTPVVDGEIQRFAALLRTVGVTPVVDIRPGVHDLRYLAYELPRAIGFAVDGRL